MAGIEHDNVINEEFMEKVARYACVYNHYNSKNVNEIFFESKTDVSFGFDADVVVALGLKEEIKFPPRCPPCCLL